MNIYRHGALAKGRADPAARPGPGRPPKAAALGGLVATSNIHLETVRALKTINSLIAALPMQSSGGRTIRGCKGLKSVPKCFYRLAKEPSCARKCQILPLEAPGETRQ
ncbi:hypothetical protein ACFOOL_03970 [Devosia honganensis]|uniref:Uncharacterized protein n=1 Tax=Devosia honganensis TaxID=1610527 RepID=A0ABV7WXC3_9HYPH